MEGTLVIKEKDNILYCNTCSSKIQAGPQWVRFCPLCKSTQENSAQNFEFPKSVMSCVHCHQPITLNLTKDGRVVGRCDTDKCGDCYSMQDLCLVGFPEQKRHSHKVISGFKKLEKNEEWFERTLNQYKESFSKHPERYDPNYEDHLALERLDNFFSCSFITELEMSKKMVFVYKETLKKRLLMIKNISDIENFYHHTKYKSISSVVALQRYDSLMKKQLKNLTIELARHMEARVLSESRTRKIITKFIYSNG